MTINDTVCVVTGAGSGIGAEVSIALSAAGASVVLAGRRSAALEQTASALVSDHLVVPTDITDEESVRRLFSQVALRFGRLDLLVNNAGVFTPSASIDEISLQDWETSIRVNLTGAFLCTREAFAMMRDQRPQGGRIINNGSISAHVPRLHSGAYAAAKHGLTGLTRSTSLDGRPFHIQCGQLDIGNARTGMLDRFLTDGDSVTGHHVEPTFDARHIGDVVVSMAALPLEVSIVSMTMVAAGMEFGGRG